jgi:hypothetical protein
MCRAWSCLGLCAFLLAYLHEQGEFSVSRYTELSERKAYKSRYYFGPTDRARGWCLWHEIAEVKPAQTHELSCEILTGGGLVGLRDHQSCSCRSTDAATTACIDILHQCTRVRPWGQ